jgi:hypothetical protein
VAIEFFEYDGGKNKPLTRTLVDTLPGKNTDGFRTRQVVLPDSEVMLKTKNGHPEVRTTELIAPDGDVCWKSPLTEVDFSERTYYDRDEGGDALFSLDMACEIGPAEPIKYMRFETGDKGVFVKFFFSSVNTDAVLPDGEDPLYCAVELPFKTRTYHKPKLISYVTRPALLYTMGRIASMSFSSNGTIFTYHFADEDTLVNSTDGPICMNQTLYEVSIASRVHYTSGSAPHGLNLVSMTEDKKSSVYDFERTGYIIPDTPGWLFDYRGGDDTVPRINLTYDSKEVVNIARMLGFLQPWHGQFTNATTLLLDSGATKSHSGSSGPDTWYFKHPNAPEIPEEFDGMPTGGTAYNDVVFMGSTRVYAINEEAGGTYDTAQLGSNRWLRILPNGKVRGLLLQLQNATRTSIEVDVQHLDSGFDPTDPTHYGTATTSFTVSLGYTPPSSRLAYTMFYEIADVSPTGDRFLVVHGYYVPVGTASIPNVDACWEVAFVDDGWTARLVWLEALMPAWADTVTPNPADVGRSFVKTLCLATYHKSGSLVLGYEKWTAVGVGAYSFNYYRRIVRQWDGGEEVDIPPAPPTATILETPTAYYYNGKIAFSGTFRFGSTGSSDRTIHRIFGPVDMKVFEIRNLSISSPTEQLLHHGSYNPRTDVVAGQFIINDGSPVSPMFSFI